jgi:hypothetical protein
MLAWHTASRCSSPAHRRQALGVTSLPRAPTLRHRRREPREVNSFTGAFGSGSSSVPVTALFAHLSYTAPIYRRRVITRPRCFAWLWLPETVHRVHADRVAVARCASSARVPAAHAVRHRLPCRRLPPSRRSRCSGRAASASMRRTSALRRLGVLGGHACKGRWSADRSESVEACADRGLIIAALSWAGAAVVASVPLFRSCWCRRRSA